jgi:hypothetical protein
MITFSRLKSIALLPLLAVALMLVSVPPAAEASTVTGDQIVRTARAQIGSSYSFGGNGPSFDCSGLVKFVLARHGITNVPRTSIDQHRWTNSITRSQLQPGDLVFQAWGSGRHGIDQTDHVAIYAGNGRVIDASPSQNGVVERSLTERVVTGYGRIPGVSHGNSSADHPVSGDWNGDGRTTQGRFRDGEWRLRNSDGSSTVVRYGRDGDLPIVGDWNGNGRDTLGIVRDGEWHLKNDLSTGGADVSFTYGRVTRGDVPIAGDWNGNGKDGIGIIRDGAWHLRNSLSGGNGQVVFTYGRITRGDVPLVGDWNGDGRDTIGIVRDGQWHLRNSLSGGNGQVVFTYGRVLSGDKPVIGDWNRDGRSGISIVRGTDWHIRNTLSGGGAEQIITY